MGAFFLYKTNDKMLNIEAACEAFREKGFDEPMRVQLGERTLLFYRKLLDESYLIFECETGTIAAVGAFTYKGLDKQTALRAMFLDVYADNFAFDDLRGHFNIFVYVNHQLRIFVDSLLSKKVFCDIGHNYFSSSMLATANAYPGNLSVNRMAVYEKMMTGLIISPDTIFSEINVLSRAIIEVLNSSDNTIQFICMPRKKLSEPLKKTALKENIDMQIDTLDKYFSLLKSTVGGQKIDTGLSGGYDSRLIFAMMVKHLRDNIHVHTHDTKGVHEGEKKVALELARVVGLECNTVSTNTLDKYKGDLAELMTENLHFFDGRSSFVIGGFNETYTAEYRKHATENAPFTLSGMGGEVFRNYYHVINPQICFNRFFEKSIVIPEFAKALGNRKLTEEIKRYSIEKAEKILGVKLNGQRGILNTRRYYSEVMMSDGQGTVIDAYNQVSDFFAPFIDEEILVSAYLDIYHLGSNGEYEAELIHRISPELAAVSSTYGHTFTKIPKSYLLKQNIRFMIPEKLYSGLARIFKGKRSNDNDSLRRALEASKEFTTAFDYVKKMFPEIDFEILFKGKYELKNISMVIFVLYKYRSRLG